jgi:adenylate cyclase
VAPALLTEIERRGDNLKLGGEVRPLTIMFSDIRSYTPMSEGLGPAELVALLNTLFGALGTEITREFGTIDKFMGDSIMAFWNAPVDVERHAYRACMAALQMRAALRTLNARDAFELKAKGKAIDTISIGIGIATGEALVGNMGLETRFDYSCVGDSVNTASRVESACKNVGYDILVTKETRREAPELAYLPAGGIELKGKAHREPVHMLVGGPALAESPSFGRLLAVHDAALAALHGPDRAAHIERCVEAARPIDQQLVRFYELLAGRIDDFIRPSTVASS